MENKEKAMMVILGVAIVLLVLGFGMDAFADDVKVCSNRTTYPTKIVVVCSSCQCPAGYY